MLHQPPHVGDDLRRQNRPCAGESSDHFADVGQMVRPRGSVAGPGLPADSGASALIAVLRGPKGEKQPTAFDGHHPKARQIARAKFSPHPHLWELCGMARRSPAGHIFTGRSRVVVVRAETAGARGP